MKANNPAAELFAAAFQQHQAGALREAEQTYKRALALDPAHVDALHYLGVLAMQAGRNDIAVELIERAISLNGKIPECHYNIGIALGALGRFEEAAEHSRKAIELKPDYAEAYMNLGNALMAQRKPDEAISHYEKAIALNPLLPAAHFNLGNLLSEQSRLDEAISHYRKAIELRPGYAEAHNNLGIALTSQGKATEAAACHEVAIQLNPSLLEAYCNLGNILANQGKVDDAIKLYRKAVSLNPTHADTLNNLASALMASGQREEAIRHYERAIAVNPRPTLAFYNFCRMLLAMGESERALEIVRRVNETDASADTRAFFAECLAHPNALPFIDRYREVLIRALSESWGEPRRLANVGAHVIAANPAISDSIERAMQAWPSRLPPDQFFGTGGLDEIAKDDLLRVLLAYECITSIEIEKFLSGLRSALLQTIADDRHRELSLLALSLYAALARQCFLNEYVFSAPAEEWQAASRLRERLALALSSGTDVSASWVAAAASYFPLHAVANCERLAQGDLPTVLRPLIEQQILEPGQEREIRASIPNLTGIDDEVSRKVRQQYEQNPYPRWTKSPLISRRKKVDEYLRTRFPNAGLRAMPARDDCLIAGCGTGQHVAGMVSLFDFRNVLAVDLSLASLSYAKRMSQRLGLNNVDYAQADLSKLPSTGKKFDMIDCSGVLHHLADPMAGWRALLSMLPAGGVMRVGLYSELARAPIVLAHRFIAERGYGGNPDEIRQCRQEIMDLSPDNPIRKVVYSPDFFSLSACRDMLFHVQEHRLTLPQISRFLDENGLKFLGFEIEPAVIQRYAERFPQDFAGTDLALWHQFEEENPDTFSAMYQFWVQKVSAH
jgi:tetratricopeptide (TPR) repeat protein